MTEHEQALADKHAEQLAEYDLMTLANEHGKFAIAIDYPLTQQQQLALERLQLRGWVTLIDVALSSAIDGHFMRIFLLSSSAKLWMSTYIRNKR